MIHYRNAVRGSGVKAPVIKATALRLLRAVEEVDADLSLTLVNDDAIRTLNRDHRGKDKPTDVLSFPLSDPERKAAESRKGPERLLGDIVISVETAQRQAADYDAPLERELERLMIHGLLHLLGHDHHAPAERRRMEAEERRLAQCIGMPWPYERGRRR